MKVQSFGHLQDGREAQLYVLENDMLQVRISNYGATIVAVYDKVLERHLALGYDSVADYAVKHGQLGATVGRVANRIANASYSWNGTTHTLTPNNGPNLLHSGQGNVGHRLWQLVPEESTEHQVCVAHTITAEEDGFPGDLHVKGIFQLQGAELTVTYLYETTEDSFVNLTNHVYFNLHGEGDLTGHVLQLGAIQCMPFGDHQIPLSTPLAVEGTPFDFTHGRDVQQALMEYEAELSPYRGYDHDFVVSPLPALQGETQSGVVPFAVVRGRDVQLTMHTDAPHFQVYTGNWLDEEGRERHYGSHAGIAIEPQFVPDDIHSVGASKTKAHTTYERRVIYTFTHI